MGVVHKLKEDVVNFIIDQKKKNPTSSIRRLAAEISEKFQIKVSKSSVSTILKNASLSSAVGRRTKNGARGEKFAIPLIRKTEISQNMQKAGFDKDATGRHIMPYRIEKDSINWTRTALEVLRRSSSNLRCG